LCGWADGCKARRAGNGSSIAKRRNAADAVQTRNPKDRTAFWRIAESLVERKQPNQLQTAIEAMRQKDFRRTHEESPTGC
jgi:hypothetical protein